MYILIHHTRLLQSDFESDGIKRKNQCVSFASFDPLWRVFAASSYFGVQRSTARSRMRRDDKDRMRSRREEGRGEKNEAFSVDE